MQQIIIRNAAALVGFATMTYAIYEMWGSGWAYLFFGSTLLASAIYGTIK